MPPILSTSHCKFNRARSCTHAQKAIPLAPIHSFTEQMVPSLCPESLTRSLSKSFLSVFRRNPIKCFLPSITFYACVVFSFVSFSLHTFSWACRSLCEPWNFFVNNSLISQWILAKLVSALPPCMFYLS